MSVHQQRVARWGSRISASLQRVSKQSRDKMFVSFPTKKSRKEKENNKGTKWFCHFIHFCAISPHITAAEKRTGAAAGAFCCLSGLAANHAHTVAVAAAAALWERSSSSEAGRRALYWPPWLSAGRAVFFFFFSFCEPSVAPRPNSPPSLLPFMNLPRVHQFNFSIWPTEVKEIIQFHCFQVAS